MESRDNKCAIILSNSAFIFRDIYTRRAKLSLSLSGSLRWRRACAQPHTPPRHTGELELCPLQLRELETGWPGLLVCPDKIVDRSRRVLVDCLNELPCSPARKPIVLPLDEYEGTIGHSQPMSDLEGTHARYSSVLVEYIDAILA